MVIRKEVLEDYAKELNIPIGREWKLRKIIEKEKRTIFTIIDAILITIFICLVIYAQAMGMYQRRNVEIIEVCGGVQYGELTGEEYEEWIKTTESFNLTEMDVKESNKET